MESLQETWVYSRYAWHVAEKTRQRIFRCPSFETTQRLRTPSPRLYTISHPVSSNIELLTILKGFLFESYFQLSFYR